MTAVVSASMMFVDAPWNTPTEQLDMTALIRTQEAFSA